MHIQYTPLGNIVFVTFIKFNLFHSAVACTQLLFNSVILLKKMLKILLLFLL